MTKRPRKDDEIDAEDVRRSVSRESGEGGRIGSSRDKLLAIPDPALLDVDRFTMKLMLYHQSCCTDPFGHEMNFSELLKTKEQPYPRDLKIKPDWEPLNLGWLREPGAAGVIALENKATLGLRVHPNEEQKAELAKMIILLKPRGAADEDAIIIDPGGFCVNKWGNPTDLVIKSLHGVVNAKVYVFPR